MHLDCASASGFSGILVFVFCSSIGVLSVVAFSSVTVMRRCFCFFARLARTSWPAEPRWRTSWIRKSPLNYVSSILGRLTNLIVDLRVRKMECFVGKSFMKTKQAVRRTHPASGTAFGFGYTCSLHFSESLGYSSEWSADVRSSPPAVDLPEASTQTSVSINVARYHIFCVEYQAPAPAHKQNQTCLIGP